MIIYLAEIYDAEHKKCEAAVETTIYQGMFLRQHVGKLVEFSIIINRQ